jgi:hypothetical protein
MVAVTNSAQTDDRGIYRAFGLPAGRYKVAAGLGDDIYNAAFASGRSLYKQVFHPEGSDQAKATVIEVGEGTEAANVDITLGRMMQTFSVAGRLVDGEGLAVPNTPSGPAKNCRYALRLCGLVRNDERAGRFPCRVIDPGKYMIFLFQNQAGKLLESITFDIIDQDVSGVTVKLLPGATVSGVVVLEPEKNCPGETFRASVAGGRLERR